MYKGLIIVLGLVISTNIMTVKKQSKYLALGDSYTIGESVTEQERWPVIFANKLNEIGNNFASPKIIAKTGWTTDELKSAIEAESIKDTFDLVTLCIGVNNQYRGRDVENFRTGFVELVEMAIKFAGNKSQNVIVLSIPDWGVTPFAKGRNIEQIAIEIAAYNLIKKEECKKRNISFIDITELSKMVKNDSNLLAKDGLHYSGKMHKFWVDEIIKALYN